MTEIKELFGYPIVTSDDLPKGTILFGDFESYLGSIICMVEKVDNGWTAYTKENPQVRKNGKTINQAIEGLFELINIDNSGTG